MDKIFHFTKEKTTIQKEAAAGLTVFFAVVYIIAVNSSILAEGGVPRDPAILATILASAVGSIFVGLYSNTPLVMIPGMGLNALFSYTIVNTMGLSWQSALVLIFSNMGVITSYMGEMLNSSNKFDKSFKANAISALTCGFLALVLR